MQKNDEFTGEIIDLSSDGEGIMKSEGGFTFFAHGGVPGDKVRAAATKLKKNFGFARIVEILSPSSDRVEPSCPYFKQCGGCSLLHITYERELKFKEDRVRNAIERIGGFKEGEFEFCKIIGFPLGKSGNRSDEISGEACEDVQAGVDLDPFTDNVQTRPKHYRNKAQFPIGLSKEGKIISGFYAKRSHRIVALEDCEIEHPVTGDILRSVKSYMKKNNVSAYDEISGKGLIRHVMVRVGFATGEVGVSIVINGDKVPSQEELIHDLLRAVSEYSEKAVHNREQVQLNARRFGGQSSNLLSADDNNETPVQSIRLTSLTLNINKEKTNVIMGSKLITIFGNDYITDEIGGVKFHISPMSFYQVNHEGVEVLYGKALEFAGLTGKETVWDLYCGIGTISLFLAKKSRMVYGVEIVPEAIENAKENAALNEITNVEFHVGAAEDVAPSLPKPDVIVVDPPRKGSDEKLLKTILKYLPERIVYVSCDPATLARDLKILCDSGTYKLNKVQPVDMFSGSFHVETVVLMTRQTN